MSITSAHNEPGRNRSTRHERDAVTMNRVSQAAVLSWGEHLLPYLFAAMETCCIDAVLIGLASFSSLSLLVPLWSPFVFIAGFYLFARDITRVRDVTDATKTSFSTLLVSVLVILCVPLTLWSAVYASSFSFFDFRWIASTFSDLFLLKANAFHIVGVLLLIACCCWRGMRLSSHLFRSELEPESVLKLLRIGLGILLIVILLRSLSNTQANELVLLLLVPIFLAFVLLAHALSQAIVLRRSHPDGLQGSIRAQEQSLVTVTGVMGLLLLFISFLIEAVTGPLFAYLTILLARLFQHQPPRPPGITIKSRRPVNAAPTTNDTLMALIAHIIEAVLLVVVVVIILATLYWIFRKRYTRVAHPPEEQDEDVHESMWSWKLFWMQVRTFFTHLSFRLFSVHRNIEQHVMREKLVGEPAVRNIREIYRALLYWSATRGIARKQAETPYEFRVRLNRRLPLIEPELSIVTEAYTEARYGVVVPPDDEVVRVREAWERLRKR